MCQRLVKPGLVLGIVASVLMATCQSAHALSPTPTVDHRLSVWVTKPISGEMVLPSTFPNQKSVGKAITITACPGEFEPASFVLRSSENIHDIQLKATPLRGDQGTIPADSIVIKVVKVWYQNAGAWKYENIRGSGAPVLVPELLLNDDALVRVDISGRKNYLKLSYPGNDVYVSISDPAIKDKPVIHDNREYPVSDAPRLLPFTLEKNRTKQIWVTVQVPEGASAGSYTGSIALNTPTSSLGKIDLRLEVLPFRLESPRLTYSLYYRGKLWSGSGTVSSEYKSPEQLRAELINMRDHGIQNPTVYQGKRSTHSPLGLEKHQERQLLEDYLAMRQELGMSNQPLYLGLIWGNASSEQALRQLGTRVKELLGLARPFGVKEIYLYGQDEAKGKALTSQRPGWERIHLAGAKIYAAGYKKHYEPMADLTDLLILYGPPSRKDARKVHALGNKIFSYHDPQSGPENPLLFRLNYGLELWRADYDGAMIYAYQHSFGSAWNDFDHKKWRDHNLAYPTTNGVIDTLAWEGLREAVDDVRYITTLETLIRRAELSGRDYEQALARTAQSFLDNLKNTGASRLDLDVVRRAVIDRIIGLNEIFQRRI